MREPGLIKKTVRLRTRGKRAREVQSKQKRVATLNIFVLARVCVNALETQSQEIEVTFLPALLLCLFMTARGLFPLARASVNCSENQLPNLMLLLQPDQVQPFCVTPLNERSQSQLSVSPELQEAVTAWATPAAVMACR